MTAEVLMVLDRLREVFEERAGAWGRTIGHEVPDDITLTAHFAAEVRQTLSAGRPVRMRLTALQFARFFVARRNIHAERRLKWLDAVEEVPDVQAAEVPV